MMKKTIFVAVGAVLALGVATPAVAGLTHNTALSKHIGVQVAPSPSASTTIPTAGPTRYLEPGDDKGGLRTTKTAEPGDDNGGLRTTRTAEPGDDRTATRTAEPGDDHSGSGKDSNSGKGSDNSGKGSDGKHGGSDDGPNHG